MITLIVFVIYIFLLKWKSVIFFLIFGPKCIFDASKHSNYLLMSLFPLWTRTYIFNGRTESSRTKPKIS